MIKIVIDIYGADAGVQPILQGVVNAMKKGMDFFPVLVGQDSLIRSFMAEQGISADAYETVDTDQFITNEDPPGCVFGGKDETSLVKALLHLKQDDSCQAMLCSGNTGAVLVGTICRLGLLPGLKFPALACVLPGENFQASCLVDCGANIDCTAADLVRFARMGNVFAKSFCRIENPRVGLMSVGREKQKGNALTKEAFEKISQLPLNFVGNLEGSDLLSGYADVIVTDGFSGNLLLKNAEAVGKHAMTIVERVAGKIDPELTERIKQELFRSFDYNSQGAATFLGPKKTVVKMHGACNADSTLSSIELIIRLEEAGFSQALTQEMSK